MQIFAQQPLGFINGSQSNFSCRAFCHLAPLYLAYQAAVKDICSASQGEMSQLLLSVSVTPLASTYCTKSCQSGKSQLQKIISKTNCKCQMQKHIAKNYCTKSCQSGKSQFQKLISRTNFRNSFQRLIANAICKSLLQKLISKKIIVPSVPIRQKPPTQI